jgi:NADPH-dependent 2,4-dienoyl-CoA reductase/sulfur reductase-like enzyme
VTRIVAIGGSDAGISAALRARELDPSCEFTVVVADAYPNFSICGIPYYVSGEVTHWRNLAHRTTADLEATGMRLRLDTLVTAIDPAAHELTLSSATGGEDTLVYDALIVGTGALPIRPPITGLAGPDALGADDGVHLLHSMGDTFALMQTLERDGLERAVMAEGLTARGLHVTQLEALPEVLPTVDPELGTLVHSELERHGVAVCCETRVQAITKAASGSPNRLEVHAQGSGREPLVFPADVVLVVVGVRPDSDLAATAGAQLGIKNALAVDRQMRTNMPDVFAAGDCVVTHHRLLGETYLPLGTTAHKQGRVAGENALGGNREYPGSLGTQVVKIFDLVAARTGLRDDEATAGGYDPLSVTAEADDHKAYYPGSHPITMRYTGERNTGRLLGVQLIGHLRSEVAKRIDMPASAIHNEMTVDAISDLDLSYTPPLGSPWEALQAGAQAWVREAARLR